MDPRIEIIDKRLARVQTVIAVTGGKGGIGKSSVASVLSLSLARVGTRVGLFDLDFCGPSTHVILGVKDIAPHEEKGIVPPEVAGIKFMSVIFYAGDQPSPLRGADLSNAIIELLAITRWQNLDYLIIDMPPGMGDTTLDAIRLIHRIQFITVTTPSKLALETVKKTLVLQKELRLITLGVIENMRSTDSSIVSDELEPLDVQVLGSIGFDSNFEHALGDPERLMKTQFATDLTAIMHKVFPNLRHGIQKA